MTDNGDGTYSYKFYRDITKAKSVVDAGTYDGVKTIKADLIAGSGQLYDAGIIDDPDQFAALVKVQRSGTSPDRVNSLLPWKLIGQFRVFAGQIQFRL